MSTKLTAIVCARPGVEISDCERHLVRMFGKYLADPHKIDRCPWCFHRLKKHGKCRICNCTKVRARE